MMNTRYFSVLSASLLALCLTIPVSASQRVDDFVLLDHQGKAQKLYYNSDATAVVLVAQSNRCPLEAGSLDALNAFSSANPAVKVMMINSLDSRADIVERMAGQRIENSGAFRQRPDHRSGTRSEERRRDAGDQPGELGDRLSGSRRQRQP